MLRSSNIRRGSKLGLGAGVESLEDRLCLSATVVSKPIAIGIELRIVGDKAPDVIQIVDQGNGHIDVRDVAGALLGAADNVSVVRLNGKGGQDDIRYTLANPLAHSQQLFFELGAAKDKVALDLSAGIVGANLKVNVDAGAGADDISAVIGNLSAAKAHLNIAGGDGSDAISVTGSSLAISADSVLALALAGDEGKDAITTTLAGQILGKVKVETLGGKGVDTIVTNITAEPESVGKLRALARGGKGVDNVTVNVIDDSGVESSTLAALHAKIFDASETDTLAYTDNVIVVGKKV